MLLSSIQLYPMPAMEASLLALVLSRQKSWAMAGRTSFVMYWQMTVQFGVLARGHICVRNNSWEFIKGRAKHTKNPRKPCDSWWRSIIQDWAMLFEKKWWAISTNGPNDIGARSCCQQTIIVDLKKNNYYTMDNLVSFFLITIEAAKLQFGVRRRPIQPHNIWR